MRPLTDAAVGAVALNARENYKRQERKKKVPEARGGYPLLACAFPRRALARLEKTWCVTGYDYIGATFYHVVHGPAWGGNGSQPMNVQKVFKIQAETYE